MWIKILPDFLHQADIKSLNSAKSLNNLIPAPPNLLAEWRNLSYLHHLEIISLSSENDWIDVRMEVIIGTTAVNNLLTLCIILQTNYQINFEIIWS